MDIDIDTPSTFNIDEHFKVTHAMMLQKGDIKQHPVGVYFQNIPSDPLTHLAAIPYKKAEEHGYTKIDFLSLHLLDAFESKKEITALLKLEPNWKLLTDKDIVTQLFHLHNHFTLVNKIRPTSIQELADVLALIRPAKKHLVERYRKNKKKTRIELYRMTGEKGIFKKSHAISYALNIVLQLHILDT
jgi:hypothetical protein